MKIAEAFKKNVYILILGVVFGVFLIIMSCINYSEDKDVNITDTNLPEYGSAELESYTASLEKKVKSVVERISGVTNVSVLITIEGTNEKVYATNGSNKDYVIIKDESGNESALSLMEINANVRGIAVICNYGGNEDIRQQIIEMLTSVFNIGANRVSVISADAT